MPHYVYRITNTRTREYYIGKRSCDCDPENDPYMGSGVLLKRKLRAHRDDDWTKEILCLAPTSEAALEIERALLASCWRNSDCLNLDEGGRGRSSASVKRDWADPEYREHMIRLRREIWDDPSHRRRHKEGNDNKPAKLRAPDGSIANVEHPDVPERLQQGYELHSDARLEKDRKFSVRSLDGRFYIRRLTPDLAKEVLIANRDWRLGMLRQGAQLGRSAIDMVTHKITTSTTATTSVLDHKPAKLCDREGNICRVPKYAVVDRLREGWTLYSGDKRRPSVNIRTIDGEYGIRSLRIDLAELALLNNEDWCLGGTDCGKLLKHKQVLDPSTGIITIPRGDV